MAFPCPRCGQDDWVAWYDTAEAQSCDLVRNQDGSFTPEYTGRMVGDSEAGPDQSYHCDNCDYVITVGTSVYTALAAPEMEEV